MNRRDFFKTSVGAAALLALGDRAYGYATSMRLQKFVQPLRTFGNGPDQIPILIPDTTTYPGIDYYSVEAGVFRDVLHPGLPSGTRLYGFRDVNGGTYRHLGGAVVAQKNRPVRIQFKSSLPAQSIIPFDSTVGMGTGKFRQDRAAIHLHGGRVPWPSDGGPFHWFGNPANGAAIGEALVGTEWLPNAAGILTNDHFYPNNQSARFMWYHDHAVGITRTNAYAGIATGYFVIDNVETGLGIPVPGDILVFQDKYSMTPPSTRSTLRMPVRPFSEEPLLATSGIRTCTIRRSGNLANPHYRSRSRPSSRKCSATRCS